MNLALFTSHDIDGGWVSDKVGHRRERAEGEEEFARGFQLKWKLNSSAILFSREFKLHFSGKYRIPVNPRLLFEFLGPKDGLTPTTAKDQWEPSPLI